MTTHVLCIPCLYLASVTSGELAKLEACWLFSHPAGAKVVEHGKTDQQAFLHHH